MKNRLPVLPSLPAYQADYYLLFVNKNSKRILNLIGDGLNGIAPGSIITYQEIQDALMEMDVCPSSWDVLNSLDHFLTLGYIRSVNDHEACASQDRMYARC